MKLQFTPGAIRAAKICQTHIKSSSYSYSPEEAAVEIDRTLQLPEILELMQALVDEAKRDLANSPNWTGNTVRVSRSRIKELSNLVRALSGE